MRYCLGCTIKRDDGSVSFPYILIHSNNGKGLKFVPFLIKDCKNKKLMVAKHLKTAEDGLRLVKEMNLMGNNKCNYFLLKVDSLNFPFRVSQSGIGVKIDTSNWIGQYVLDCK